MTRRIQPVEPTLPRIRDLGPTLSRVEAGVVAAALGAEASAETFQDVLAPITLQAVRQELVKRLQSSGGRPALTGVTRRAKVPLSETEWAELEGIAAAIASPGFAPSAGQVASVLLTLSVHSLAERMGQSGAGEAHSPLHQEPARKKKPAGTGNPAG